MIVSAALSGSGVSKVFSSTPSTMMRVRIGRTTSHGALRLLVELQVLGAEQGFECGPQLAHVLDLVPPHSDQEGAELGEGVQRRVVEQRIGLGRGGMGEPAGQGLDQILLGIEVVVEGALADAELGDDLAHRRGVVAVTGE